MNFIACTESLAGLEVRASQLTQSLEAEGRTHRPIDVEALQSLEEALTCSLLFLASPDKPFNVFSCNALEGRI
jgi:hypothetical protein